MASGTHTLTCTRREGEEVPVYVLVKDVLYCVLHYLIIVKTLLVTTQGVSANVSKRLSDAPYTMNIVMVTIYNSNSAPAKKTKEAL